MDEKIEARSIFGGLWRMKTSFESDPKSDASHEASKTIWIFSDMMNETPALPMPALIEMGPKQMLERACLFESTSQSARHREEFLRHCRCAKNAELSGQRPIALWLV